MALQRTSPELSLVAYHKKRTGKDYDIDNPTSFNEKILWRKLNDQRPILTELTDKANIKNLFPDYAIQKHEGGYPFVARPNNYSGRTDIINDNYEK